MGTSEKRLSTALPAAVVLLLLAGWLAVASPAEAIPNSVGIEPGNVGVAPGGSVTVELVGEAPLGGLGAWVVDVKFDPSIITTASAMCDSLDSPPGAIGFVTGCEVIDADEDGIDETVKVFGGAVFAASALWADVDGDGEVDSGDAMKIAQWVAGLTPAQVAGTPPVDSAIEVSQGSNVITAKWADVDGDGEVDSGDAMKIAQWVAGLTPAQVAGTPTVSSAIEVGWGLQGDVVLASITFDAIGEVGECSALELDQGIRIFADLIGLGSGVPTTTNGEICIE